MTTRCDRVIYLSQTTFKSEDYPHKPTRCTCLEPFLRLIMTRVDLWEVDNVVVVKTMSIGLRYSRIKKIKII